jgi:hypothetical protein
MNTHVYVSICVYRKTFLLVLDAVTMTEKARCYTTARVPADFHGAFFEDSDDK